jgi:uncharacterized protein YjbI with pentapeptide repeats
VLTAFIRSHAPWPPRLPGQYVATAPIDEVPELQVRAADVQASLTVLGRGNFAPPAAGHGAPLDLHAVDLRYANLSAAHLQRANLRRAHLEGATLFEAHLERADFLAAHLERANFLSAHLEGANFFAACPEVADLRAAHLERAYLITARLGRADLRGAHLNRAILGDSHLEGALGDKRTGWPDDFDWRAAGIIVTEETP